LTDIILTVEAAKVLVALIASCGTLGCKTSIGLLKSVSQDVSLASIGLDENGGWRMGVFSRLFEFSKERDLKKIDTSELVSYFSGTFHIEYFRRHPGAGLGNYIGPDAGLVTHVLLPLDSDFVYRNQGFELSLGKEAVFYNKKEVGIPCYHLGVIINLPISEHQKEVILAEQANSKPFMAALAKVKGPIVPPADYLIALRETVNSSTCD
jgi:hypothetical protein